MKLGEATSSYDSETEVLESKPWQHLSDEDLQKAAAALTGNIMQLPPMYSAIKMGGALRAGRGWVLHAQRCMHSRAGRCMHSTCSMPAEYGC
jgi:tRNA U55 pseudouridine synthase TruB